LALTADRASQLRLPPMAADNRESLKTAFTVSIEAKDGVTTGISAADRARTIQVATDPMRGMDDLVSPGHIFPLVARDGGVLVRAGHTEAAVDISRMAGLNPSGVICEIMNDDGTMARMPDLVKFAQFHGLKIATIADLIAYRRRHDKIVRRELEAPFHSKWGDDWRMVVYVNQVAYAEHVALVKGDISDEGEPVMVRVHAVNILDDVLGDQGSGKAGQLHSAMEMIAEHGRGVVVLVREPRPTSLSDRLRAQLDQRPAPTELRDYGIGAQILLDLGVRDMILLSNTKKTIIGLEGFGLEVVEQRPIPGA
ncbi:MAG: 3,4-dihydroxy-2-butanone-4-phosphate synthase, partial [Rhodospirillaceae bacterium]|nr:3,4-dihydroxy-2-butanone-4-phosphate synthase [Rhodospirillales bacterium]